MSRLRWLVFFALPEEAAPFQAAHPPDDVRCCVTGVGPLNSRRVALRALEETQPHAVLTCGYAGGLRAGLAVGQIVFSADPTLRAALQRTSAVEGVFAASPRIVVTPEEKAALRTSTGADAVDMESAVIRELCRERGIPSATVRVISDTAEETLPLDFNRFLDESQQMRLSRVLAEVARKPSAIPGLLRLRRQTQLAGRNLARVLREVMRLPEDERPS